LAFHHLSLPFEVSIPAKITEDLYRGSKFTDSPPFVKTEPCTRSMSIRTSERKYDLFYILGLKGTIQILKYLREHKKAQYKDLRSVGLSIHLLNDRLRQLLKLNLISHHLVLKRRQKRKEWYELTEKGKKILKLILELEKIVRNQAL